MGWIVRDYLCNCGHSWEDLVKTEEQDQMCPDCGVVNHYIMSATHIGSYSLLDNDGQAKSLRKRSRDHTKKQLKKDPTSMKMSKHVMKKR